MIANIISLLPKRQTSVQRLKMKKGFCPHSEAKPIIGRNYYFFFKVIVPSAVVCPATIATLLIVESL
ncbi:hypothetical protein D3C87_1983730 [compost metagenome]